MSAFLHFLSYLPLVLAIVAIFVLLFLAAPVLNACDLIKGRLWAIGVIVLVGLLCTTGLQLLSVRSDRDAAQKDAQVARSNYQALDGAMQAQKKQAAAELAAAKAEVADWQARYNGARRAQEIQDANFQTANDKAQRALRAASDRNAGRLRDPWAEGARCGGGGQSAGQGSGVGAGDRAADAGEGSGLLSAELTRRLEQLTEEADAINRAYATCRVDAYTVRGLPAPSDP
jgi:type II secretory pathway pseudopilin PulG